MRRPGLLTGVCAGLTGGLAASWVMGQLHQLLSKGQEPQGEDSTMKAARDIARTICNRELTKEEAKSAGPLVHYGFGGAMGALYGAATAANPGLGTGAGLPFGAAEWLGAHAAAVPALGWSEPPTKRPLPEESREFATHLVYGLVTDLVRRGFLLITAR